ncbi:UDP-N-acetylmuramate--L-alanine ligase [Polystyrenella longa]|nr:UDP-N-acetylmuramate--L-alanine ligase [Polystyrenella longa]
MTKLQLNSASASSTPTSPVPVKKRNKLVESLRKVHLVGICGSGMKALAEYLTDCDIEVTGSDLSSSEELWLAMQERGWNVHHGHQEDHLASDVDLLIYSPAVTEENPERVSSQRQGIAQLSYTEFLGKLLQDETGLCIAGTHGKSTTTAMTSHILESSRLNPSVFVGAELCGYERSGWAGAGDLMVVESCEYRRHFLNYAPQFAAILGIEADHFDCYATVEDAIGAYAEFARNVSKEGTLLVSADSEAAVEAAKGASSKVATFSVQTMADWWATDIRSTPTGQRFRIFHQGEFFSEIEIDLPGEHNVSNALAATAICYYAGCSPMQIRAALARFEGLKRRFESVGSYRGVTLIDDYAHHPTAVAKTLTAARQRFPNRRLWAVYQPHQASRTTALEKDFVDALELADEVIIARTFAARESSAETEDRTAVQLAEKLSARNVSTLYCGALDQLIESLDDALRPGDVLLTMGAGDIDRVHNAFTRRLFRNHAS